ncbi:response regulator transcription factor [Vibrio sp. R78045]|uniref:response regulator transcription factor n=1 Tax=Vibrio sp. R78045 TaxID=3093868 RepID=UPI0036F2535F
MEYDTVCGYTILDNDIGRLNSLFPILTEKQFKVLHLFAMGVSTKNIAAQMQTSEQNVKNHQKTIRDKFNCSNSQDVRMVYMTRIVSAVYLDKV